MLADTEDRTAPARAAACRACASAPRPARPRCRTSATSKIGQTTWFASFAPYEEPALRRGRDGRKRRLRRHHLRARWPSEIYTRHPGRERQREQASAPKAQDRWPRAHCNPLPPCLTPTFNDHESRIDRLQIGRAVRPDAAGDAVCLQRDDGQRVGQLGALVQPELVPADHLVCARDRRGGGVVLRGLSHLARWSMIAYWVAVLLLVVVLILRHGAVWGAAVDRPGLLQLQPSEFAKLAFILALAHFLSRPVEELRVPLNFWKALGLMLLPFVLILKEPDLGSALVLLPTGLAMLFVAGTPRRYLVRLLGGVGHPGRLVRGGRAVRAAELADQVGRLPAAPADGVFRQRICSASRCVQGGARTPAQAAVRRLAQCAAGVDLRRLRRADGQRLAAGHAECPGLPAAASGAQRLHLLRHCRGERIRRQRDRAHAVWGGSVHRNQNRRPGARSPGQMHGGGRRHAPLQPCLHQYRHEHSDYARDGRATAAAKLRRVISARLVDRHGHACKTCISIERPINYE